MFSNTNDVHIWDQHTCSNMVTWDNQTTKQCSRLFPRGNQLNERLRSVWFAIHHLLMQKDARRHPNLFISNTFTACSCMQSLALICLPFDLKIFKRTLKRRIWGNQLTVRQQLWLRAVADKEANWVNTRKCNQSSWHDCSRLAPSFSLQLVDHNSDRSCQCHCSLVLNDN